MFKNFISFLKARKSMRLIDRAKKLTDDLLDFIEEKPASITILTMIPISASFTKVMAAMDKMVNNKIKENKEKKEE